MHSQGRKQPRRTKSQGPRPPEIERCTHLRYKGYPCIRSFYLHGRIRRQVQHQGNTEKIIQDKEWRKRAAVIKIIKFKGKFLPTPTGGGPLKRQISCGAFGGARTLIQNYLIHDDKRQAKTFVIKKVD